MKYRTGNPVGTYGSSDPRDMYDNAGNLDLALQSDLPTWKDRQGVSRKTLKQHEREVVEIIDKIESDGAAAIDALIMISAGDFTTGTVVTARNQTVLWPQATGGDGKEYRWIGALYKNVPADSTPLATGGIYPDGSWVDVGVTQLRRDITSVPGIKYLKPIPGITQHADAFIEGTGIGGDDFVYDPNRSWFDNNGDKVISVGAINEWDGTFENLSVLENYLAEGTGCYIRKMSAPMLQLEKDHRNLMAHIPHSKKAAIYNYTSTWDASDTINTAINELGGGTIWLPRGRLSVGKPIRFSRGVEFIGGGPFDAQTKAASQFFLLNGANCPIIQTPAAQGGEPTHYMSLNKILFDGNKNNQTVDTWGLVQFHGAWIGSKIDNVMICNARGSSLTFDSGADVEINHIWLLSGYSETGMYMLDFNRSYDGTDKLGGLFNANHLYVEQQSKVLGGSPRQKPQDRGNGIRFKKIVTCNVLDLHVEGMENSVLIEDNILTNIVKSSFADTGDVTTQSIYKIKGNNRVINLGPMHVQRQGSVTHWVGWNEGFSSSHMPEMKIGSRPWALGYSAQQESIKDITPRRQSETIFNRNLAVSGVNNDSCSIEMLSGDLTKKHFNRAGGHVKQVGTDWPGSEVIFWEERGSSVEGAIVSYKVPISLALRASRAGIAPGSLYRTTETMESYVYQGIGPAYQRAAGAAVNMVSTVSHGVGAPTRNADYLGEMYIDISQPPGEGTQRKAYIAISYGFGVHDWKEQTL